MTWEELFERAAGFEVAEDDLVAALKTIRQPTGGESAEGDDVD